MKKVWTWIKLQWAKLVAAVNEYTWRIKPVTKGVDGINTPENKVWMIAPSLFTRANKTINQAELGFVWFGFGLKLQATKKIK